jgi:tight adherence protein B
MSSLILIVAIGVGVAALVAFAAMSIAPESDGVDAGERLAAMSKRRAGSGSKLAPGALLFTNSYGDSSNIVDKYVLSFPNLRTWIEQSDVKIAPSMLVMMSVGALVGGSVLVAISPIPSLLAPVAGLCLACLPAGYVWYMRKKRLTKFSRQLPDALDLLGRALRSGHSIQAGFNLVGTETKNPLGGEFMRVFEEQNLGIPLDEALDQMANRIPDMDLRFFATAVVLQRTTGGDLAEILAKIAALIRARLKLQGTIAALTGEGRLSGAVLLSLPPVLFLVLLVINPEYVMALFHDDLGKYMLLGGVLSQIAGAIVIKKIITIRV